jgi:hypothetical protein
VILEKISILIDKARFYIRRVRRSNRLYITENTGFTWCVINDNDIHNVFCRGAEHFDSTALFCLDEKCTDNDLQWIKAII